jgi:hypothetical protein
MDLLVLMFYNLNPFPGINPPQAEPPFDGAFIAWNDMLIISGKPKRPHFPLRPLRKAL